MRISEIAESANAATTPWQLLKKLAKVMDIDIIHTPPVTDVDFDEAVDDAIKLMTIYIVRPTIATNIHKSLRHIRSYISGNGTSIQIKNDGDALGAWGFEPPAWFQDALNGNAVLVQRSKAMTAYVEAVTQVYDFLMIAYSATHGTASEEWTKHAPFVRAVFRKLGIT